MLQHCVFVNFRKDISVDARLEAFQQLACLQEKITGMESFQFGPNLDFEKKSQDYSDGFIVTFTNPQALEEYAKHPDHVRAGGHLVSLCEGGRDGIMVFDLDV